MLNDKKSISFATVLLFAFALAASAKSDSVNHDRGGTAIQGYDPVAYFTDSKPLKGNSKFSYSWHGSVWLFTSGQHRDLFAQNPEKYAPQYGGYCAYGVSEGHTVDIDPNAWKIIDGRLYINYDKAVQQRFLKDPEERIRRADQNWPGLHK